MFLGLIPVIDASAESPFNKITDFFDQNEIPFRQNLIGFGADGANNMFGHRNSVASRFKELIPDIFLMKCICHSFNLCASYACLKLPRGIEDLARNIYSHFQSSPKRMGTFNEFQSFLEVKPHKLLHPSQTRWLSLEAVVNRLLEQYPALLLYFTDAALEEKLVTCEGILEKLRDPLTKLFLKFLQFVLPTFTRLNRTMQSESSQLHRLYTMVRQAYKFILECYFDLNFIHNTPLHDIDPRDNSHFVPLTNIYIGSEAMTFQEEQSLPEHIVDHCKQICREFYIEAAVQIKTKISFK